jgi:ABC-type multidrug transport system fused ATPase/permease subunit
VERHKSLTGLLQNYMNAVERITQYSHGNIIEQEASHEPTNYPLSKAWPTKGTLELNDVVMSYRKGLPPVLKGISMSIRDGEKIGVVGRTGAGKTVSLRFARWVTRSCPTVAYYCPISAPRTVFWGDLYRRVSEKDHVSISD